MDNKHLRNMLTKPLKTRILMESALIFCLYAVRVFYAYYAVKGVFQFNILNCIIAVAIIAVNVIVVKAIKRNCLAKVFLVNQLLDLTDEELEELKETGELNKEIKE